ncbi:MAG: hypothetical protein KDA57_21905 [Planctomycetales bacterium]|nr:hypothetical protein [Planctomycetales bacterium]
MSWLKIETITPEKPEVFAMAETLGIDPDAVFGKLFRVWAWFDDHTQDGCAPSATSAQLNRITSATGFAEAMQSVGWLVISEEGLILPNFERHNGQTAKSRALAAKRMTKSRCAPSATEAQQKRNQRREEKNISLASAKDNARKVFSKPAIEEIHAYAGKIGKEIDAEEFWDYYEANGWRVGRNPMKDWQAAVRTWIKRQPQYTKPKKPEPRVLPF